MAALSWAVWWPKRRSAKRPGRGFQALSVVVAAADQGRAAREGGAIEPEVWFGQVFSGDPAA